MPIEQEKILVCCPQNTTGGPELLHQLVHEMRLIGKDARICYYPFDKNFECPEIYKKYDAPQSKLLDKKDVFIIIPETATWITRKIKNANIGIWWLSVDNYFLAKKQFIIEDIYRKYKSLIKARVPLIFLKNYTHFSQSNYAKKFLASQNIESTLLTDYLSKEHLKTEDSHIYQKNNIVAYNPKKGFHITKKLISTYKNIVFVPIENMNPRQVAELLQGVKIYIDFGNHPGKDRPPREAAMAGCCVITGQRGSAAFHEDVCIPSKYKLDEASPSFVEKFGNITDEIFKNYSKHSIDFNNYRSIIINEKEEFKNQIKNLF